MKKIEVKNIIGGISQQPALQRFENQCSEMINCIPSATEFLRRRYGTHHIAEIEYTGNEFIDFIKRSDEEYGLLIINKQGVASVYDLAGNLIGKSGEVEYLVSDNPRSDLRLCTIRDYNFLLNTKKKVQGESVKEVELEKRSLCVIKQAAYGETYYATQEVLGVQRKTASYTVPANPQEEITASDVLQKLMYSIGTENFSRAYYFCTGEITHDIWGLVSELPPHVHKWNIGAGNGQVQNKYSEWNKPCPSSNCNGKLMPLMNLPNIDKVYKHVGLANVKLEITDSAGGTLTDTFKNECKSFSDLPLVAPHGYCMKVIGDTSSNEDDYYIEFVTEEKKQGEFGEGYWKECAKLGEDVGFIDNTMPHILKITDDGIVVETAQWEKRKAGDRETNPAPDIVDKQIKDIVFYKNRLGLLTDDGITFSESKRFFNFFATTATTMLDSDPVSVAISGTKADALKHAVSYMEALFLYSNASMYALEHGEVLSNSSAAIKPVIQFDTNMSARPVVCDTSIYYTGEKGEYVRVREYKPSSQTDVYGYSNDITSHIPRYIEQGIYKICVSLEDGMLFLINGTDKVYCYSFIKENNELLQSAWHKWIFGGNVLYGEILQGFLYLLIKRNGVISFEKLAISHSDTNFTDNLKSDGSFDMYKSSYTFSTFFIRSNTQAIDMKTLLKTMTIKAMEESVYFVRIKRKGRQEETRQIIGNSRNRFLVMAENKDVEISIESYRDSNFNIIEYDMEVVYANRSN